MELRAAGLPDTRTPGSLGQLSPWLDHLIAPRDQVWARLAAQQHRRFIKTHTPLDGIPLDPRATYLVTARHPLDMAVSLYHQGGDIDRARVRQLTGQPGPARRRRVSRCTTGCSAGSPAMMIPANGQTRCPA